MQTTFVKSSDEIVGVPGQFDFILEAGKEALMYGREKEAADWFLMGLREAKSQDEHAWISCFSSYLFTCL